MPVLSLGGALFFAAVPVMASHTSDHAIEELSAVVAQAEQDMDEVVAALQQELAGLASEDEVGSAEASADDAIQALWGNAKSAVNDLVRLFPAVLGPFGAAANQQLQAARQTSQDLIAGLAHNWMPPEPLITTTTLPVTTTSPPNIPGHGAVGPPPDTGPGSGGPPPDTASGSGGPPPNTANGTPPNEAPGSSQNAAPDGSNPFDPDLPAESHPITPPSSIQATQESSLASDLEAQTWPTESLSLAQTPGQPLALGQAAVQSIIGSKAAGATERMAAVLNTVLPPAVVDLVLSPLLILEILARTTWEGGLAIVGPLSLLGICAMAILVHDRRSKGEQLAA